MSASLRESASISVTKYASETTTHGPLHLTGDRPAYIKSVWLFAFLVSLSYGAYKVLGAYRKYVGRDLTTTVKANAVDFEFPDVYFCNERPISSSYSATLRGEDIELLASYRKLVTASMANETLTDERERIGIYARRLVNTLPYQFLSDKLGHREDQTIIDQYFQGQHNLLRVFTWNDPFYLNCFGWNFSSEDIHALQLPSNSIYTIFFLDPELPIKVGRLPLDRVRYRPDGSTIELKPWDWDFNNGVDYLKSAGLRVFICPRGQLPSEISGESFILRPDRIHRLRLEMQDRVYTDFESQCEADTDAIAEFVNPYSLEKQAFRYSQAVCWYRSIARMSQAEFNCSLFRFPIPWEYRTLPSCFNLSEISETRSTGLQQSLDQSRGRVIRQATEECANKMPCRKRSYSYQYSLSSWLSESQWQNLRRGRLAEKLENRSDNSAPGVAFLFNNGSCQQAQDSFVYLEVSSAQYRSSEVQLSLAYKFDSLIADLGGLLGLFVGISLLSVLELIELIHDCLLSYCRCRWRC